MELAVELAGTASAAAVRSRCTAAELERLVAVGRPGIAAGQPEQDLGSFVWPTSIAASCTVIVAVQRLVPGCTVDLVRSVGWLRFAVHSERCPSRSRTRLIRPCT